jgi:hypothetical protein
MTRFSTTGSLGQGNNMVRSCSISISCVLKIGDVEEQSYVNIHVVLPIEILSLGFKGLNG